MPWPCHPYRPSLARPLRLVLVACRCGSRPEAGSSIQPSSFKTDFARQRRVVGLEYALLRVLYADQSGLLAGLRRWLGHSPQGCSIFSLSLRSFFFSLHLGHRALKKLKVKKTRARSYACE